MRIDPASVFYQIEVPRVSAFLDLLAVIPTFMEEPGRARGEPGRGKVEQRREWRKGPGRHDLGLMQATP